MEIELSDVSGLPEHLKPLVEAKDGKNLLNLAALAPAADLERFKAKAITAEGEAIERRKALKAWEAFGSPDDVAKKLASGADPEIVKQLQAKLAETEAGYKQKFTGLLRSTATETLKAELAKAGVVPEGLDLLAGFAAARITFDDDGGMRVMAADGTSPMIGKAANGGATLADLAAQLAKSVPQLVKDAGAGGGGKPPGSTGGTPEGKTVTRAQFDAMSQGERVAHSKSGGKVTD
jgi:hypothetical protein